jgi:uncharacterized membrane protein YgdD (TMEM256/DUF423 family)
MQKQNNFIMWGAALMAIGVSFGALGAHALKKVLSPDSLAAWETGVRYQLIHALAILIIATNDRLMQANGTNRVLRFLISGVLFFSGSIYLLSTQSISGLSVSWLGPFTPIGGVLMIGGWIMLFLQTLKNKKQAQ